MLQGFFELITQQVFYTYRRRDEILEQKAHPEANDTTPVKVQK